MKLKLPTVKDQQMTQVFAQLERNDLQTFKRDEQVEIRTALILVSPNGTRYKVTVSDAGVLSTVMM